MVPQKVIEAAVGMGCTRSQVVWKVILPTAFPGILTGVMLSVARAAGETAPLLFTALFSSYWIIQNGELQLMSETATLAVFIYRMASSFSDHQNEMAWAAALVLVFLVLLFNLTAQFFARKQIKA
jgi:phosphate transport system permease protein